MKPLHWIGSSLKDVRSFSEDVRSEIGFALYLAQQGEKSVSAVPMVGFGGAKVLEVVIPDEGDTFRAVYTVKFVRAVYVLHVFQKKSKKGAGTPKPDLQLINTRLKTAERHYNATYEVRKREKANERGA